MDLYARVYGGLLMPTWEYRIRHRPTMEYWALLERSQWETPMRIRELQLETLRSLLRHARDRVPYYRELFAKVGFDPDRMRDLDDFRRIPTLSRSVIHDRYEDLVDRTTAHDHIHKRTSGSSGTALAFEYDRGSEVWRQAVKWRGYGWAGYRPGVKAAHYWGLPTALEGLGGAKIRLDRALRREIYIDCLRQDAASLEAAVERLRRTRPRVLVGYTLATATLARFILERGYRDIGPISVICAAESLLHADRAILGRAFGGEVFESYGSRETMLLAAECERHHGLHSMDDAHVIEIEVDGRPARPGETGEVIVTDLHNFGMPFIRYKNGDLATACSDEPCPCGRGLGRIANIAGRQSDTLRDRHGNPVPGMMIAAVLAKLEHQIREYQVVQRRSGTVTLRVVQASKFQRDALDAVVATIRRYLDGLPVEVEFTSAIDRSAAGKHRPVVVEQSSAPPN